MDILRTAREIGFFETGYNLTKVPNSISLIKKIERDMPLPDGGIASALSDIPEWLRRLNKSKYMFLNPEIALIEHFAFQDPAAEAIIVIPSDMDYESEERLLNNLPRNMKVSLMHEPSFPGSFFPCNGVIIACGYMADNRPMVLPETYRMLYHYWHFWGKKVFVPYVGIPVPARYNEWLEFSLDFSMIWRPENA